MVCEESYKDARPSSIRKISDDDYGPFKYKRVSVRDVYQFVSIFSALGKTCALGLISSFMAGIHLQIHFHLSWQAFISKECARGFSHGSQ
jgi:hypothetical protein